MRRTVESGIPRWSAVVICAVLSVGLLAAFAVGCARRVTGPTIRVSGAWALYPMMLRWAEEYRGSHPDVIISVAAGGAGKGAADALAGRAEIGMISREIHPDEIKQGGFSLAVAKDGVFATVNAANPVTDKLSARGVDRSTLAVLWTTRKIRSWGYVVDNPNVKDPVRVYTRYDACGAAEAWARYLGVRQEDLRGIAETGDDRLAKAVKRDPLAIGFNGLAYAYDATTGKPAAGLQVVPIDINGDDTLDDSEKSYRTLEGARHAIATGAYPAALTREISLLTKGRPTGVTREFMRWILGDGQEFVADLGYVELPRDRLDAALAELE